MTKVIRRRLTGLLVVALVGAVALGSAYVYRNHRRQVHFAAMRALGLQAAEAGDYPRAVALLEAYLPRNPTDVPALVAYIHCRPLVPAPQNAQWFSTIVALRHLLRFEPDRIEERRQLL